MSRSLSKFMSLVLRHNPKAANLSLDKDGYAEVDQLILNMNKSGFKINFKVLEEIVNTNDKKRFAFSSDKKKIKAVQGHSIEINHSFEKKQPPDVLFHGTPSVNKDIILKEGLKKMKRHHVHLSPSIDTAKIVGERYNGRCIVLSVNSKQMHEDGIDFLVSENGVWLVDFVDPQYITV